MEIKYIESGLEDEQRNPNQTDVTRDSPEEALWFPPSCDWWRTDDDDDFT